MFTPIVLILDGSSGNDAQVWREIDHLTRFLTRGLKDLSGYFLPLV